MFPSRSIVAVLMLGWCLATPVSARVLPSQRYIDIVSRADSLVTQRQVPAAERYLDSLVTAARATGNRELEMVAVLRRSGSWLYTRGSVPATAEAERAIVMARTLRDTVAWCRGLMVVQYAAFDAEKYQQGEAVGRRLIQLAKRRGDLEGEAVGWIGVGYAALQNAAHSRSAAAYRRAIAIAKSAGIARHELRARVGLSRALFALGEGNQARAESRAVIALAQSMKDSQVEAEAWNNLGAYEHKNGDPSMAPRYYERSIQVARKAGMRTATTTANLAMTQMQLGRFGDAAATLMADQPGLARSGTLGDRLIHARALGEIRASQRRFGEAESLLTWCWRTADSVGSSLLAVTAGSSLTRFYSVVGRFPRTVEFGDQLTERYGARMSVGERLGVIGYQAQALCMLGQTERAARLIAPWAAVADTAQQVPDMVRAGLHSMFATALMPTDTERAAMHLARAARFWESARAATPLAEYRESESYSEGLAWVTATLWLRHVRTGTRQYRDMRAFEGVQRYKARTLSERGSAGRGIERRMGSWNFSLGALQRQGLKPGEVLLDFHLSRETGKLFVVTPRSLTVHSIPGEDSLRILVARFRDLQRDPRSSASLRDGISRELSRILLGPAAPELTSNRNVLLSPSGSLGSVPFAVLFGPSGSPLAQTHVLGNVPSANWLIEERRRTLPSAWRLAVVGRTTDEGQRTFEGIQSETRWLTQRFARTVSRVHAGDRSVEDVLQTMRQGQVVHVAAHAEANAENPWDSALLIGQGDDERAWLTAHRIALEKLPARLVVIAGCNTDVRSPLLTQNVNGLSSAFLVAGASTVVATLWAVDDQATLKWTEQFYSALASGKTVVAAAQAAQSAVRADPAFAHPAYWAPFVVIGDPTLRVRLESRPSFLPTVLR